MSSDLLIAREGDVGFITFNRPQVHNAISREMWRAIPQQIDALTASGVRVLVFTGQGESFASGADLEELRCVDSADSVRDLWHAIADCLESIWGCEIPTIAMVNGPCIGGGCLLATACDFRLASNASSFAIPVARLGILLDDRTIGRLVASGGVSFAREILLLGATVSAPVAKNWGYVHRAVELDKLRGAVTEFSDSILRNVQASVVACKKAINNCASLPVDGETVSDARIVASYLSDEFRKRVQPMSQD